MQKYAGLKEPSHGLRRSTTAALKLSGQVCQQVRGLELDEADHLEQAAKIPANENEREHQQSDL